MSEFDKNVTTSLIPGKLYKWPKSIMRLWGPHQGEEIIFMLLGVFIHATQIVCV